VFSKSKISEAAKRKEEGAAEKSSRLDSKLDTEALRKLTQEGAARGKKTAKDFAARDDVQAALRSAKAEAKKAGRMAEEAHRILPNKTPKGASPQRFLWGCASIGFPSRSS
jgi:hypothetical protein